MSKKTRKPRQLSEKEVYRDAAQILEDVLESRLGKKSIKSVDSSNTYSSSGYYDASGESLDLWLKDDSSPNFSIERSQTMPSSFKLEEKDDFTEQDIKDYMKTKSDFANRNHSGSATSGESDDVIDSRVGSPLRRKKSFMKRAKERLSISFRRQGQGKENNEDIKEEPAKKERKKKKKNKDNLNDKRKASKIEEYGDYEFPDVEMRPGSRNRSDSTASKRSSIFDSIRKSFRKRKSSTTIYESQSADPIVGRKDKDSPPKHTSFIEISDREPIIPTSNTNAVIDLDDIKYIDDDKDDSIKRQSGHSKENIIDELPKPKESRNKPAPPPPKAPPIHVITPLGDGHTGVSDISNDDVDGPVNESETPFSEKSDGEKNDILERIAVKLIEMADNRDKVKSSSDTDGVHAKIVTHPDHSSSVDPEQLTALEQELLECLRVGGDRLSQSFDDPIQVVIEQHRKKAYSRFYDTLRKGLGDEMSWNQMSLVYQTAFGAIKAAGVGSQLARRVKDMTQQYVGDKFASWIVKEGGWDSMLSGSDSEVN